MNEQYDVVVCGTGLVECIISGLLSQEGKRVLHIDRNPFYGGEGASLNITNLWKHFSENQEPPKELGQNRDWNIDLIPKFIMSNGKLVKLLLKTRVSKYLEWKSIDGTYVYQMKEKGMFSSGGAKIEKVPATDKEAIKSDLMGLFEKRRCKNFFQFIQKFNINDPKTWEKLDVNNHPFSKVVEKFELEPNTIDFLGHAVALYTNDDFIKLPAIRTIEKIQLYMDSHGRYGDSPFIYPVYGLGGIPEGFSRMCAINGGTFMLNTDISEIIYENGKIAGVKSGNEIAKCSMVVCDPTYAKKCGLQKRLKLVGNTIRCICILDHPIPETQNVPSVQIIIPQRQTGRKSDIFVLMISSVHQVCKQGYYVAIISTNQETNKPEGEVQAALDLLGPVKKKFFSISEQYIPDPASNKENDGLFISSSMDPTSHFEGETENVLQIFKRITGKDVDLENLPEDQDE